MPLCLNKMQREHRAFETLVSTGDTLIAFAVGHRMDCFGQLTASVSG